MPFAAVNGIDVHYRVAGAGQRRSSWSTGSPTSWKPGEVEAASAAL
jgi:hypothetical protein